MIKIIYKSLEEQKSGQLLLFKSFFSIQSSYSSIQLSLKTLRDRIFIEGKRAAGTDQIFPFILAMNPFLLGLGGKAGPSLPTTKPKA